MSRSNNMSLVKVVAALAILSAPIGCIASSETAPEATGATSDALLTAADLPDYGFTAFTFGDDTLKAGLTITDPAGVPLTFTIEGVDPSGTKKVTSTVKLVSIDATNKIGLYARTAGEPLGEYYDLASSSKSQLSYKSISLATFNIAALYNCYVNMKPPGPPRCIAIKVPSNG